MVVLTACDFSGRFWEETIKSPRLRSISCDSVSVTASPASACGLSPSKVTMEAMVVSRPEGRIVTASPGWTLPATIVPA